jgi:putative selenate reductase
MPRDLFPIPFPALVSRLDRELKVEGGPIYSATPRDIWIADPEVDLSVEHMAGRIGNALGPASGPHTQMAQNIVLSYLCGARFMELKTVQILDELEIPRPCIYIPNIGFNVEWSQELRVHESAREYVSAWYLLHALRQLGPDHFKGPSGDFIFDLSVGYGLEGIQGEKVTGFVETLQDNSALVEELRGELRAQLPAWADVEVPKTVVTSTTLSTFHGCPADEIEGIAAHTLEAFGLHTVIKLNPTLLGYDVVRGTLDKLGYGHIKLRKDDFEKDLNWSQLMDFLPRLEEKAKKLGLGLGVKFSNTLVCENPDTPFAEDEMYMSGPPLHVLALTLADKFKTETGGRFDISFSAGVDPNNFWKLASAGLKPVTTCSDILKGQGYARLPKYLQRLEREMKKAGAKDMAGFEPQPLEALAAEVREDVEFTHEKNKKIPRKVGSSLHLFDCLTCDKCLKICPNMANVTIAVEKGEWDLGAVSWDGDALSSLEGQKLIVKEKHQIGNVVDLCNECGQCDPWCPEDGGPFLEKPHLFLQRDAFEERSHLPGFLMEDGALTWRNDKGVFKYVPGDDGTARLECEGGALTLKGDEVVSSEGSGEVELRVPVTMRILLAGFTAEGRDLFT